MKFIALFIISLLLAQFSNSQTIGLLNTRPGHLEPGYILFAPISSFDTFIIDKCGNKIHSWTGATRPGQSVYLLENGDLLRTGNTNNQTFNAGGKGGLIQRMDWDGNLLWSYSIDGSTELQHHDVELLPNGNVLAIVWELKTAAEAIAMGRNPANTSANIWSEKIIEIEPIGTNGGNIVWEWHLWDHLTQDFDPTKPNYGTTTQEGKIDLNYNARSNQEDWIHLNSVDYNEALDQIIVSSHSFDEVWIIDHSTTVAEALTSTGGNSGKGGDLLYRWGNPVAYGEGTTSDQKLDGQHHAYWIESGFPFAGQLMIFNNGTGRNYSSVEIIDPPLTGFTYNNTLPYLPQNPTYSYNNAGTENLFAQNISGSQMLSNGNVLICSGPSGEFIEIDVNGNEVWRYKNPVNMQGAANQGSSINQNAVFRATFYPAAYAGFVGRSLVDQGTIENSNMLSASCTASLSLTENPNTIISIYPNPAQNFLMIDMNESSSSADYSICNSQGQLVLSGDINITNGSNWIDTSGLSDGLYFITISVDFENTSSKFIVKK